MAAKPRRAEAIEAWATAVPHGVLYIGNRDYVVDEERGVINVFCRFGNSAPGGPDAHTYRLVDGQSHLSSHD